MLLCFVNSAAPQSFSATMVITNDPASPGSVVTVNPIYYDPVNQKMRLDYPNLKDPSTGKPGFKEYYDFQNNTLIQLCNICTRYTYLASIPKYYKESTDVAPSSNNKQPFTLNNVVCTPWQKVNAPSDGVKYIWTTATGIPCRAERVDGTTYDFTNVKMGAIDSTNFNLPAGNNCPPVPKCGSPIDLVLVLDESGSITRKEWSQIIGFSLGVVNSFVIGPNDTQVGLVFFSGVQYEDGENPASCCGLSDPALPLSFDNDTITKFLVTHQQTGGHTCINCGVKAATAYEPNRNRPIQVPKIMLVLTDGFNNRMTDFFNIDIQNARNQGWNMFAIGVRNASLNQLSKIASKPEQLFMIDDFNGLALIANTVKERLCGAFPTLSPCGPMCAGKCVCGGKCVCPDSCASKDKCETGTCVTGVSESQCLFTKKFCDPTNNKCKINQCDSKTGNCVLNDKNCTALAPDNCYTPSCDPNVGCVLKDNCPPIQKQPGTDKPSLCFTRQCDERGRCTQTPRNCTSLNACTVNSCDPVLGCVSSMINCDDGNRCTVKTCDPYLGCQSKPISCPSPEFFNSTAYKSNPNAFKCLTYRCDPNVGCVSSNKTCDDGNLCTADRCNPVTGECENTPIVCPLSGNLCVLTSCDEKAGCLNTKKNCDDGKFCTEDTCNPSTGACVNTPITCPVSTDNCTNSVCDEKARGCVKIPKLTCDQPTDKCKVRSCQGGQCVESLFNCPPPNLCSTAICNSTTGECMSVTKVCDDKDSCTSDSCDLTTGNCTYTPIPGCTKTPCTNCVSTNPCFPNKCENGSCITSPVVCAASKCATLTPTPINGVCVCVPSSPVVCTTPKGVCGESICDPATGICGTINNRVCDDNNPCTNDICTIVNGKPSCSYTAKVCGGDSPCSRTTCKNINGIATCVPDPSQNSVNCSTNANGCSSGACNPLTGQCVYTTVPCSNPSNTTCARNICNALKGTCEATAGMTCPASDPIGCGKDGVCILLDQAPTCKYQTTCPGVDDGCISITCVNTGNSTNCQTTKFNCDDNNPCTNEVCKPNGVDDNGKPKSKCVTTPFICPPSTDVCKQNLCVNVGGRPVCQLTEIKCNSTSKCLTGKCVVENNKGVCKYNETNCGVSDKCTNYVCDPKNGCTKILKCNDGNPCTDDICDPKTGNCTFVNKVCNSTNLCRKSICDPNIGCVQQPVDCANITGLDACHYAVCVNTTGCKIVVIPGTLDACGFCNKPGQCAKARKSKIPAGAIAGAVIGGAIIAGIVAFAIGLFAGTGGSVAPTPGSDLGLVGGDNNPLYCEGDNTGTNPFEHDYNKF